MMGEFKENIGWIALIIVVILLAGLLIFGLVQMNNETISLKNQCIEMGYETFEREGWTGDFCKGPTKSLQVTIYKNKLVPLE